MEPGPELDTLRRGFAELSLPYTAEREARFRRYLEMLYQYREKVHLISRADYQRIALRHFLPSLLALPDLTGRRSVADIGAGAGFPSVPLKIVIPSVPCTVFESVGKKAQFLKSLVRELQLPNIEVINDRAEKHRHRTFDIVLARAVGSISLLVKIAAPMIGHGGAIVLLKSRDLEDELKHARVILQRRQCVIAVENLSTPVEHVPMNIVRIQGRRSATETGCS